MDAQIDRQICGQNNTKTERQKGFKENGER